MPQVGDGVDHPVDDLRAATVSRSVVPSVPRKYFWATMLVAFSDHVDGELDTELLEGDRAVLPVRDAGVAPLPGHLVVGVRPRRREVAADADGQALGRKRHVLLLRRAASGRYPGLPLIDTRSGGSSP